MSIKSFRGQIASGDSIKIRLHTNNGLTGYIVKDFRIMGTNPTVNEDEAVVKLFSAQPLDATGVPTADALVDLSAPTLLAVGLYTGRATTRSYPINEIVIFESTKINQDLFLTSVETVSGNAVNYYIELEQIKLDTTEATVATLKDMRGRE